MIMGKGRYGNDKGKREKEKYQREMKQKDIIVEINIGEGERKNIRSR